MKKSIPVVFSDAEVARMLLKNGVFSVTRFKRVFRNKVRALIADRLRVTGLPEPILEVGRVTLRRVNAVKQRDFLVDITCLSGSGHPVWRQTFRFIFTDPGKSLAGALYPGIRHLAR